MNAAMLALDPTTRADLWRELVAVIERSIEGDELPVFAEQDAAAVRAFVERVDFDAPLEPVEALRLATDGLSRYTVNIRSPRYFGLFDPAPTAMGIVAEALTAAFNPQLAAWLATPFAIEAEVRLIR